MCRPNWNSIPVGKRHRFPRFKTAYSATSLFLSLLGLVACASKFTPIAEVKRQQPHQDTIYVEGIVRDRAPLLKRGAYELQDETGTIWVITKQPLPESGQAMTVQAKIKSKSIVLHKQLSQEVYLQEVQRLP